jgi:hypothetical protein
MAGSAQSSRQGFRCRRLNTGRSGADKLAGQRIDAAAQALLHVGNVGLGLEDSARRVERRQHGCRH